MAERIAQIRERVEKATPGPWSIESCGEKGDGANMIGVAFGPHDPDCTTQLSGWLRDADDEGNFIEYYRDELVAVCDHTNRNCGHDANLIAHAPADIAYLLARLASAEEALRPFADVAVTKGQSILGGDRADTFPLQIELGLLRKAAAHFSKDKSDE